MLADLDLLLITVFCAADDLLPARPSNARRMLTDAEVVTLCVAQAMMGIPSDERFLRVARKHLAHLFPRAGRSGRPCGQARLRGVSAPGNVADFEPGQILRALEAHHVQYVVIGAIAAIAAGAPILTTDIDVTPARSRENLERLALALRDLGAKLRSVSAPDGVPFPIEPEMLATADSWTLTTSAGDLDLMFLPSGTQGYDDLRSGASKERIAGVTVSVDALADVIRPKGAEPREGQHATPHPSEDARADPRARPRAPRPRPLAHSSEQSAGSLGLVGAAKLTKWTLSRVRRPRGGSVRVCRGCSVRSDGSVWPLPVARVGASG